MIESLSAKEEPQVHTVGKINKANKPEHKNSVITFLSVNERTWNKYLRNKEILYKKE